MFMFNYSVLFLIASSPIGMTAPTDGAPGIPRYGCRGISGRHQRSMPRKPGGGHYWMSHNL